MNLLKKIFGGQPSQERAAKLRYAELVASARAPELYTDYGVPDTLDGRFEAIIIYLFIEEMRLKAANTLTPEWLQLLHESFFADMDRSLREGGVGDTGISKRVQRMASGFYGRLTSYRDHIDNEQAFTDALIRNVYATEQGDETHRQQATKLAEYIKRSINQP